ncbi:MAG: hypothetical protein ACJAY7_000002 [Pseudohongiellaceae bacterium]|jgi:hypothetical protein
MDTTEKWHSSSEEQMTFGLPKPYEGISAWASSAGMHAELEVAYFCLGRPVDPRAIRNFANEFTQPISQAILSEWSDKPIVIRLWKFSLALSTTSEYIPKADAPISHQGKSAAGIKSEFAPLRTRYFLLAMIVNPRSHSDEETVAASRQRLRLWLIIQSAIRIAEKGAIADSNISHAARHIILDRTNTKWGMIDNLLTQARHETEGFAKTFQWFNYALERAAKSLLIAASDSDKTFLGALDPITRGNSKPLPISTEIDIPGPYPGFEGHGIERLTLSDPDLPTVQNLHSTAENEEDESDDVVVDVDISNTDEEQALTSRSVFLYSAEESQYLPWSWDKLLPPEIEQLNRWLANAIGAKDPVLSLGAAVVKIATDIGVSLFHAERIAIDEALGENWSITPDFRYIQRLSPKRHNSWYPELPQQKDEVLPFIGTIRIALPSDTCSALARAAANFPRRPKSLGTLWNAINSNTKLTVWFDNIAKTEFPRVTSGKLGQQASQRVFENTGDHNLARIVTAAPQSGLPAACGYANWDVSAIAKGIDLPVISESSDLSIRMLGSLLAPVESVLTQGIDEAKSLLAQAKDLVSFHNRYVQYCLLALYAGTGGRYLKSPFECLSSFNLRYSCIYINDKSDGYRHGGRLTPLPDNLVVLILAYLEYLSILAKVLVIHRPELAAKIQILLDRADGNLPLFFLLDEQLCWHETSESDLLGLPLVSWSLPANLFRHRYSQRLTRAGVPFDIVDGWMGHSERGGATYGDFSPRCWSDDAVKYQAACNTVYDSLNFTVINVPEVLPQYVALNKGVRKTSGEPSIFGLKERRQKQRQRYKNARRLALQEIKYFIGGKDLEEIDASEIEILGTRLLKRENGLPHPDAGIRFRALEQFLKAQNSKHTRSIRKKILKRNEERNLIKSSLPVDIDLYDEAKKWSERTSSTVQKGLINKTKSLIIGTTLLCIEKRLSYRNLLLDVVEGKNFRLIQDEKKYYIEYSEEWLTTDYFAPVQRHEIGYKTASLLHYGSTNSRPSDNASLQIPEELHSFAMRLYPDKKIDTVSVSQLLKSLAKIVEQANLIQLPGLVAGALSERLPPTSLNWSDFMRLRRGEIITLPVSDVETEKSADFSFNRRTASEVDKSALQDNAKEFYDRVTVALNEYEKKSAKQIAKNIDDLCKVYRGKVGSTVQMMPCWISYVIREGQGRGKHHKPYAKRTLLNYFSTLRLAFQGIAYSSDLLSMDSESITDLYHDMVESRRDRDKEVGYFGKRLKSFHRWAARFGVENPSWSEIDTGDHHRSVSPGCFTEKDYLACQDYIRSTCSAHDQLALYLGFVLLLTFRFGLRGGEAIGLRRQDWCQWQGFTWVLVRDNRIRQLKRPSSRRAIPLLFSLSRLETDLIERVLANYDSIAGLMKNAPLLCESRSGRVTQAAICQGIQETLTSILRSVTGSQSLTTHHGRHSFHNHVSPILLGFDSPTTRSMGKEIDPLALRKLVLGQYHDISIRSSMGLSRLMGHSGPSSGLKNYCHLVTEWADVLTPVKSPRALVIKGIINTKDFVRIQPEKTAMAPEITFIAPTLLSVFKLLRLVAQGRSYAQAGKLLRLHPEFVAGIQANFDDANRIMRFKKRGENAWFKGANSPNAMVQYITEPAWDRLIELADKNDIQTPFPETSLPVLDELPLMLGMTRQIKMSHSRHCEIVRRVFDVLGVHERRYDVTVSGDDPAITRLLMDNGFAVRPIRSFLKSGEPLQLNVFNLGVEERRGRIYDYGVIILSPENEGVIRNTYELAVAFLAAASLLVILART